MALTPFVVPRLPIALGIALAVIWLASWPMARYGYIYNLATKWAAGFMVIHAIPLILLGYLIWPTITVNPKRFPFQGYPNETVNFSVRNGRADDVYDVQIPFLIGYNKHFDDKLTAKVVPNGDPPQRMYDDYNYCYGTKGDGIVSHVQKNEREVLIVRLPHMAPYSSGSFSITYTGGEKFEAKLEQPNFIGEPYSYSPMQGTVGVRGNYRICRYAISTDGLMGK